MNPKRFLLAVLAVFGVAVITDLLMHGVWLGGTYAETALLWRPEPEQLDRLAWVPAGQLLTAAMFVTLWATGFAASGTWSRACWFGVGIGLLLQGMTLIDYAMEPLPGRLALSWFAAGMAQSVLMGVVVFLVYRPLPEVPAGQTRRFVRRLLAVAAAVAALIFVREYYLSGTHQPRIHPTAPWMQPLDSTWVADSPGKPYSIQTTSDLRDDGEDALRFELRGDDRFVDRFFRSSSRAEVDSKDFPPMHSVRWYAIDVFLPADFPREKNWCVLAQWHGVDKRQLGEPNRIPVMAFVYDDGRFLVRIRHSAERVLKEEEDSARETPYETPSFPLNQWNHFVVQARWSYEADGFVNVWLDGKPIVRYRGPVGYNDNVGPYFRFGLYHGPTQKTYVAWFSRVRSGTSPEDIGFNPTIP